MNEPNSKSHFASPMLAMLLAAAAILALSLSTLFSSAQSGSQLTAAGTQAAPFSSSLPQLDGTHLRAIVVEVNYAPGESDKPHSHPCAVIGYVAQGSLRFQVKGGGPVVIYKTGESFYEPPNGVHQVSGNASEKDSARLIAFFVCDHETKLTVPPVM